MFRNIRASTVDELYAKEFDEETRNANVIDDSGDDVEDDYPSWDSDNVLSEDSIEMEQLLAECSALEELFTACSVMQESGATESMIQFVLRRDLLSGTSMQAYALESFSSTAALEGLIAAVAEKAKAWTARAISSSKKLIGTVVAKAIYLTNKLSTKIRQIGSSISETAKVHPYATAALAVTALVAITAVVVVASGNMPSTEMTSEMLKASTAKMRDAVSKVKLPFNTISFAETKDGFKILVRKASSNATELASSAGGWTATQLKSLCEIAVKHSETLISTLKDFGVKSLKSLSKTGLYVIKEYSKHLVNTANAIRGNDPHNYVREYLARTYVILTVYSTSRFVLRAFRSVISMMSRLITSLCNSIKPDPDAPVTV